MSWTRRSRWRKASARYRTAHPDRIHQKNKSYYAANSIREKSRLALARAERRAVLDKLKLERGCADCGYRQHPAALDFDHRRGVKLFEIGTSMWRKLPVLMAEMEKCDVVCANCHRIRTAQDRVMDKR